MTIATASSTRVASPSSQCSIRAGSRTARGLRETNQDRCYVDVNRGIFIVADGVGGHPGGEEASCIAVDQLAAHLEQIRASAPLTSFGAQQAVQYGLEMARARMQRAAHDNPEFRHMGCTLAVVLAAPPLILFTHLGDCRIQRIREGRLEPLTRDETYVAQMVQAGILTEQQARLHPWRHLVLNCLGAQSDDGRVVIHRDSLQVNDRLLISTDGLHDSLSPEWILDVALEAGHPQEAADALVRAALEAGSRDNVSCVVMKAVGLPHDNSSAKTRATDAYSPQ